MTVVSLMDKLDTGLHLGMVKQIVKAITELKDENKKLNERIKNLEDADTEIIREALLNLKADYDKVVKEIKEDNANNTL